MRNFFTTRLTPAIRALLCAGLGVVIAASSFCAETQAQMSLDDKEAIEVQQELAWLTWIVWGLIIGLLLFAASIRFIAKRTTRPCHWCMEFISNNAETCPRCGKSLPDCGAGWKPAPQST